VNGILTYGSLLNTDELEELFPEANYVPVRIDGYRRHFAQKSTFRDGENGERGVLAVEEDENSWCNGLLIYPIEQSEFDEYKERESGYEISEIEINCISPYKNHTLPELTDVVIPCGARPLSNPKPIPTYAALCIEGAQEWGDQFVTDFLLTTDLE